MEEVSIVEKLQPSHASAKPLKQQCEHTAFELQGLEGDASANLMAGQTKFLPGFLNATINKIQLFWSVLQQVVSTFSVYLPLIQKYSGKNELYFAIMFRFKDLNFWGKKTLNTLLQ